MANIKLNIFEAGQGDSFLIEFDNDATLLIDGGTKISMQQNIGVIKKSYNEHKHNYMLLTHIDDDHINGMIYIFERCEEVYKKVTGVIFNKFDDLKLFMPNSDDEPPSIFINESNTGFTGFPQGRKLEDKLEELNIPVFSNIVSNISCSINDISIKFLSPSLKSLENYKAWLEEKEEAYTGAKVCDYSKSFDELLRKPFEEDIRATNLSSISILIEYKDKKLLFLGDSKPSDIVESLNNLGYSSENKLFLDIVKVSHHGSKYNTSLELLEIIQCNKFLISTDGKKHGHPDKECLARIIRMQKYPELIFNYNLVEKIFSEAELQNESFKIILKNEVEL